jgi:hypothetical protein
MRVNSKKNSTKCSVYRCFGNKLAFQEKKKGLIGNTINLAAIDSYGGY